ncbi:MAG: hypothetical protein WC773_04505, partial [Patescibacteria group bacterium]
MAKENDLIPSKENPPVETQVPEQDAAEAVEEPTEGVESPPAPQVDYEGKIRALEERFNRSEERNRYLEQTARLLDDERRQRQTPQRQADPDLPNELLEL